MKITCFEKFWLAINHGCKLSWDTLVYTYSMVHLLEKLTGLQLVKKFPTFHGTRRFITPLTSFCQLSLSWSSSLQSIYPHRTSWRSTHLCLGLPSGLLPSGFPTKTLYTPFSSPICATGPAHLILLDFITCTMCIWQNNIGRDHMEIVRVWTACIWCWIWYHVHCGSVLLHKDCCAAC